MKNRRTQPTESLKKGSQTEETIGSPFEPELGSLHICYGCVAWCSCGLLTVGAWL